MKESERRRLRVVARNWKPREEPRIQVVSSEPCFISAPPYILSSAPAEQQEQQPARGPLFRRGRRSRHLLLALFFPATRHLHNYNLATAVSRKLRPSRTASAERSVPSFAFRLWTPCCWGRKTKRKEEEKEELLPLTSDGSRRVLLRQKQSRGRLRAADGMVKPFLREHDICMQPCSFLPSRNEKVCNRS